MTHDKPYTDVQSFVLLFVCACVCVCVRVSVSCSSPSGLEGWESDDDADMDDEDSLVTALGCLGPLGGFLAPELQRYQRNVRGKWGAECVHNIIEEPLHVLPFKGTACKSIHTHFLSHTLFVSELPLMIFYLSVHPETLSSQ